MRRFSILLVAFLLGAGALFVVVRHAPALSTQAQAQAPVPIDNSGAQRLAFQVVPDFLKYPATMNLGEVLGVAVNSKGEIAVLNHPGSGTTGPIYGAATTQIFIFDRNGRFVKEIGQGVYGLAYAHAVRYDRYDNLWVVDKATNSVMKFNPAGYVTMNLGRRPEGYETFAPHYERAEPQAATPVEGYFNGPTDIGWDAQDNIYISEGYVNNRIVKYDKNGDWVKAWGRFGEGGASGNENPGNFRNAHGMAMDRQGNVYAADRGNRRIQVFNSDGQFLRFLYLNAPYDKRHRFVLGNTPANRPDATQPWAICITPNGPTQYLFAADQEPGRLYKMTLDGRILGYWGQSGREADELNWPHAIACPTENEVYIADMNNWRVTKLVMNNARATAPSR